MNAWKVVGPSAIGIDKFKEKFMKSWNKLFLLKIPYSKTRCQESIIGLFGQLSDLSFGYKQKNIFIALFRSFLFVKFKESIIGLFGQLSDLSFGYKQKNIFIALFRSFLFVKFNWNMCTVLYPNTSSILLFRSAESLL